MQFPKLESDRLLLRKVESQDAATVLAGYSDPLIYQHMSVSYHSLTEVQAQLDWYDSLLTEGTGIWWGICLKDTGEMIGNGGLHRWDKKHHCAELGYWILPIFQRRGYVSEAIGLMVGYAFQQLAIHRIEAIVESENEASGSLLLKNGFLYEGTRRECEWVNGRYIDLQFYARLNKK